MTDETELQGVAPIRIRRVFQAPPSRVFAAFTQAGLMSEWMCPPGFSVTSSFADAREGGNYRIEMEYPKGDNQKWSHANTTNRTTAEGVFSEVVPLEKLVFTIHHDGDKADELVTVEFLDQHGRTEIAFEHMGLANEQARNEYLYGWQGAFEKLSTLL